MRRASSDEDSEWANTSATKSTSFATCMVTMKGYLPAFASGPTANRYDPASHAEFAIGCARVLAKNRCYVHGRARAQRRYLRCYAKAPWHHAYLHSARPNRRRGSTDRSMIVR